jgi:hypothetical protein
MTNAPSPTTDTTMKEKEEILRNDRRASTMHGRASADLDLENTGRFAKPHAVIGVDGAPDYPRLPSGPWADPVQVPPEEPLGYDINEAPIVGEAFELGEAVTPSALAQGEANTQASVATQSELAPPNHLVDLAGEGERSIVGLPSNDDVAPAPASSKPKPTRRSR